MVYIIYKPRLQGVFNKYTTRVRGQRKLPLINPRAFQHLVAMIHMIYTMMKTIANKITIEISTFSHESNVSSDET